MDKLTHTDAEGKARMVDVSPKPPMVRKARAKGKIKLASQTVELIQQNLIKKGDVLTTAEIAGVQAAKQTGHLIPLCHPLYLSHIEVKTHLTPEGVEVEATVTTTGQTGVEMEALTAVSVALLTVYDMCKAVDKAMVIENIHLIEKTKTKPEV
ncbi:MAG: cyclic pyranopterin monophosphate synthase MoaC [Bacteroidales bacterium]|jgi:cyclic pyranopterin phosphate synthase|nr:cyclic pyranopterin monophosphate synthase MoaC [Bacteroidales bacterium]NPV35575.1 cyclic pyranopterin monophosphate synthase MoaC [Bacteroidales bacterium]